MPSDIAYFAGLGDRSTGSPGCEAAAQYIVDSFKDAGLTETGFQELLHPIPEVISALIDAGGTSTRLYPWGPNMVYLSMTSEDGLTGPLIYVGDGRPDRFDGLPVQGSIVLMEMSSYNNWMNAAMFGAGALIFLGNEESARKDFQEKNTPTPIAFPRFWAPPAEGERLKRLALDRTQPQQATVRSKTCWRNALVRNCYALIPGKSTDLKEQLVVIEAFYDASAHILGFAPGADEAVSIAMLLNLAREFAANPPERSVLLVATAGNGQALAGMRAFVWAATERKKSLKDSRRGIDARKKEVDKVLDVLKGGEDIFALGDPQERSLIWDVIVKRAKDVADSLTREAQYRKTLSIRGESRDASGPGTPSGDGASAGQAAGPGDARPYRKISWRAGLEELTPEERPLAQDLLKGVDADLKAERKELKLRRQALDSSTQLRSLLGDYQPVLFLSLNLSSNASAFGLIERGETYPFREQVKRQLRAARLDSQMIELGQQVSRETGFPNIVGSASQSVYAGGESGGSQGVHCLGCDVAALASCAAVSLAGLGYDRSLWGVPGDTIDRVNMDNIRIMSRFLPQVIYKLCCVSALDSLCQDGFGGWASLEGKAMFLRQGELFPDQPAPGSIISVIQGGNIFRTMANRDGSFFIPGLANNKVSLEKLILEPYGVDSVTGRVAWTADKAQTGKENYRIKVKGRLADANLTMFHCDQTDVVGVIQPQKMGYLTKVEILDAVTEARPVRYWYSRVDSRDTMAISVFLEPGARFKLILSETLLQKEFILLNGSKERTDGKGFLIGNPPSIPLTPYQVAQDMRFLLGERLDNLHKHGIVNRYLETLYEESSRELESARAGLENALYGRFWEDVISAWAKLVVVYTEIGGTQRDVLMGVMFFIALFVPFAFVVERYLFSFRNIYRQLAVFFIVLLITIFVIRGLHPAFQLTYSPMVVIIAFFIVGLSLLVSWIIFVRFEAEMTHVRSLSSHGAYSQANKWQAFGAGFTIGASNLNRRRLRTALTCATLVILTFTVMSFTSVKSLRSTTDTKIGADAPYYGVLLHHPLWLPLTLVTLEDMKVRFPAAEATVFPRAWITPRAVSERSLARVYFTKSTGAGTSAAVEGVLGLGDAPPDYFKETVVQGGWFDSGDRDAVLLPLSMAGQLGLSPQSDIGAPVQIWGRLFHVRGFFDENILAKMTDLDGKPLTPAYLEASQDEELTEVEVEAMQSGEVILPATERFRYSNASATVIVPFDVCLAHGGELKAVSIIPKTHSPLEAANSLSSWLAFPLFVGDEGGAWFHSAGAALRYQGVTNLFIPILIVVFICLNTMIGHVQERQKEIATYTSVGLAPSHVGFLFIVEALSLAVLSTVIGYILAQLSAKYLGNTAAFSQLTFNYSSLASVACMFLVFSVVFIASLYPAKLAARMAMPDVNQTWELPAPVGDVVSLYLPFLLKYDEEKGIMGFLASFFTDHEDSSHGKFTVDGIDLDLDSPVNNRELLPNPVCLYIRTNVWLAPFDFGIKQRVELHCCPSEENPGYMEIHIRMVRLSGEKSAWVRANWNFIKEMRKRMLLWRLLQKEDKSHYLRYIPETIYKVVDLAATRG
jgi:hypothetical protein